MTSSSVDAGPPSGFGTRHFPIGAEIAGPGAINLRVWAPDRQRVAAFVDNQTYQLRADVRGYHAGLVPGSAGSRYGFLLDEDPQPYPDPASRFQPDGPHGLSQVIDPAGYVWHDEHWRGVNRDDAVLYELHVGTFTPRGTYQAAGDDLARLAALGVTVVQVMPVADFPGRFGWGYDGVNLFAPSRLYGRPDDLRHFVDRAHALGVAVILDVVYNHVGPDGNYLRQFGRQYFSDAYRNEWGDALNFDGAGSESVREWVLTNVAHWIREYHVDGFRLSTLR